MTSPRPDSQTAGRHERVLKVARGWANSLIDSTGRNQLLFCRDTGKLLLDDAPAAARQKLLASKKVHLTDLFPDPAAHAKAAKATEAIRRRIQEYDEERGVRVGRVAYAFASWKDQKERTVRAPVLLRDVEIARTAAGFGDHDITADPDLEVNPVLVTYLESEFNVSIDQAVLDELNDQVDDPDQVERALDRIRRLYVAVPEFRITPGLLLGTFHYAKLAMVEDLRANALAYADNALFAAVAGDDDAILAVRRTVADVTLRQPDLTPPRDEFLVLDADPSQNYVINAALAGRNLVVQGPPGTGKSQTIANLISVLAARGKRVLFVAEKRAAIDAVLGRLQRVGLGSLTLDLHTATANRAAAYEQFSGAIEAVRQTRPVYQRDLHERVARLREAMIRHDAAMHMLHQPWGVTVFDLQAAMLATPEPARSTVQLARAGATQMVTRGDRDAVRDMLGNLVGIDGLLPVDARGPWATATLDTIADATAARDLVRAMIDELAAVQAAIAELAALVGARAQPTPAWGAWLVEMCRTTMRAQSLWRPELWQQDLGALLLATGNRAYRRRSPTPVGFWQRRKLRRIAQGLRLQPGGELHRELSELATLRREWAELGRDTPPTISTAGGDTALRSAIDHLTALGKIFGVSRQVDRSWDELTTWVDALAADPGGSIRAAQVRMWTGELRSKGLGQLLTWLANSMLVWPPDERREFAEAAFEHAWHATVLEEIKAHELGLATFNARNHQALASQFIAADREHIDSTPERILRLVAERLTQIRTAKTDQELFLDKELTRKRKLKPLRELVARAPDILLAAKPCWAMSPLLVSQMLPPQRLFDVVIFDEASQVQPAEAVTSLARARTAVVAGDSKQLPPTTFFEQQHEEQSDEEEDESLASDVESILDAVNRALGQSLAHEFALGWHYRSEDARLIAFSNAQFYDNRLTTFPGTAVDSPLRLNVAESTDRGGGDRTGTSDAAVGAEVDKVIDLALEHARNRPQDTLGIIALSLKQANRIEDALHRRLRDESSLQAFFADDRDEPCFVKNLERVQGDERDAIILSVGFGKVNGRLVRRFGPLNLTGGERRLNVAVTRARRRMTVVSSFSPSELDPDSVTAEGAKSLAQFLRYAESGGDNQAMLKAGRPLNPFEINVRDRLLEAGLDVVPQWGVAGYFIDFVVPHPQRREQMVLAIEADGATYHSAETARARGRLRQEHLERLGWRFHRIWSTEWFNNREAAVAAVMAAYKEAVARADTKQHGPWAPLLNQALPAPNPRQPEQPSSTAHIRENPRDSSRRGPRPHFVPSTPISQYSPAELVAILQWIKSDGILRTDEELLREASQVLGYSRLGSKIRATLSETIRRLRS